MGRSIAAKALCDFAWKQGEDAHTGAFAPSKVYTAELTLTAKAGYTFTGVAANTFTYTRATAVTNAAGSGTVTITFPATTAADEEPDDPALSGNVTISPDSGVTTGTELTAAYSGSETVTWQWNKDGAAIAGATAAAYTPNEAGSYTATAIATGYQSKTSAAVAVTERVYAYGELSIGDTGPGGGKIFYTVEDGFGPGNAWHYLEAAPADISEEKKWAVGSFAENAIGSGAQGTAIGTGAANTAAIVAAAGDDAPAAKACADLTTGGKTDWFLPSKDELGALKTNKAIIDNMPPDYAVTYWSSSENASPTNKAWRLQFYYDEDNYLSLYKPNNSPVRAVRAF